MSAEKWQQELLAVDDIPDLALFDNLLEGIDGLLHALNGLYPAPSSD